MWWNNPKCEHVWRVASFAYTQPIQVKRFSGADEDTAKLLFEQMQGSTHIVLRCLKCKDITDRTVAGIHEVRTEAEHD